MSIEIHQGDALELFSMIPDGSVDLIFADPPFNIRMKYDGYEDGKSRGEYLGFARAWVDQAVPKLAETGAMVVMMSDEYVPYYHLMMVDAGLVHRNTIIWHYTFGQHLTRKFGRDHTQLLYFTKHRSRFTFNADSIRAQSARQRQGDKRADPRGRVPGDVWQFPRLPGNSKERTGHPCQISEAPIERLILALTSPGEFILDPFAGSGTVLAVAKRCGRRATGFELSPNYCDMIRNRLETQ